MNEILQFSSLWALLLTLLAYLLGRWIQRWGKLSLLNPLLTATAFVLIVLNLLEIPASTYIDSCDIFSWIMTPATVSLALPLYDQFCVLRKNWLAISAGIAAGALSSLGCVSIFSFLFKIEDTLRISLLPKSVTSAMGVALSEQGGGVPAVTTTVIVITGILGGILGPAVCRFLHLTHPVAQGVAFGTASHVIGTTKAAESSETAGAVSSLSLVLAGVVTAILFPIFSAI